MLRKLLAAYAASDWDAYKEALTADCVYEEIATGKRETGIDNYIAAIKRWKIAFPDLEATFKMVFESRDTLAAELEWTGTHKGPLETAFGTLPATNKSARVGAVLITKHKDGKIVETRHYFDQLTLLMQIGAPVFGARPTAPSAQPVVH